MLRFVVYGRNDEIIIRRGEKREVRETITKRNKGTENQYVQNKILVHFVFFLFLLN